MENMIELQPSGTPRGKPCPQCGQLECGQVGRPVDTQTVKAMLAISLHAIHPAPYYFCPTTTCAVVYFTEPGDSYFREDDLRERVYQKHPHDDDSLICYCFGHTLRSIRDEWQQTGKSTVLATITAGTRTWQCACDIRNPQGTCCLGNVSKFVQQLGAT